MEGMERTIGPFFAKDFERLILGRCSEGIETQILMLTCGNKLLEELIVLGIELAFCLTFKLCILSQSLGRISQRHLQLHCTFTGLATVSFINDNSEGFAGGIANQIVNNRELLKRGNDNAFTVLNSLQKILGAFLFVNENNAAQGVIKAVNGILQLAVEHLTVGNDNNGIINRLIFCIVQACKTVSRPSDTVGFARTCAMLN